MQNIGYNSPFAKSAVDTRASRYISGVYLWMALGVLTSAAVAWAFATSGFILTMLQSTGRGFFWLILILQFGSVIGFSSAIGRMNVNLSRALYFFYAVVTGATLALISFIYTMQSIVGVFGLATFAFACLAIFGAITKRNLGPIGTFCSMGLYMLIGFQLLFFIGSMFGFLTSWLETFNMTTGILGILIFSGLTAWESQRIREQAYELARADASTTMANVFVTNGAFSMYLNFINLFISLLRVFGQRR